MSIKNLDLYYIYTKAVNILDFISFRPSTPKNTTIISSIPPPRNLIQQRVLLPYIYYNIYIEMGQGKSSNGNCFHHPEIKDEKNTKANEKFLAYIHDAFRNCSTNGSLTKDKFNQALAVLESLGFKRLRDTPLADRLFYLFDKVHIPS